MPEELEGADSYRVYFESTVGEYLQTELLTPADGYVTVKITSDVVPEPGNMAAQLVAFADGEIVGYAPVITGTAKVSIPDGTERLSPNLLAAEIALNTAARHSHDNKAVLDKFAETDGKPTYGGEALGGGASTAEDISYTLSEDVQTTFPDIVELESDTVKSGLDVAMYYAIAGMFAKNIACDLPSATGTITVNLQSVMDGWHPILEKAHEHDNKSVLDNLSYSNGKLQYNGSDVSLNPVYYIDLAGTYPNYTCPVTMDDIKAAYNSGYNLVCRCKMGAYTATLPLFIPMPAANTWIFSGSGALQSMGFPAQSFTIAITSDGVMAQQAFLNRLERRLKITVGDEAYFYDGSELVDVAVKPATQLKTTAGEVEELVDNTEYRLADIKILTLNYPAGEFECWMRLTFAASGTITVTLPTDTKYIGTAPDFKNGETWELSFKDKVLAAQKVGEGT